MVNYYIKTKANLMGTNYDILSQYSEELGNYLPSHCGNNLVAGQYYLPIQIISKYLPDSHEKKILDWGCGIGHFSYLLMIKKFEVYSYSYTKGENLNIIKEKFNKKFHQSWRVTPAKKQNPVHLPYKDEFFDAIVSVGVLEHVRENAGGDELLSLQELYRILKPNGMLFVFHFPNKYSWIEMTTRMLNRLKITHNKFSHQFLYRKSEIKDLISKTQFTLLELGKYNLFPRAILRFFPKILANQKMLFKAFNGMDQFFQIFLKNFSQNYFFVLKK